MLQFHPDLWYNGGNYIKSEEFPMSDTILVKKTGAVAVVYLNRPETLNCFNNELLETLRDTCVALDSDRDIRVVVLTGSGRGFCAGGDLGVLMACDNEATCEENMRVANEAISALFHMKKPTIAMVNGAAAGAGFNLALACDMIFASEKTKFIQSFVNVGIASDCGGHYLLRKAVGDHLAKELMFTARPVTAQEGKTLGFVNRVCAPDQLEAETMEFAEMLAKKAPLALSATKVLLNKAEEMSLDEVLAAEAAHQTAMLLSQDCKEGIAAFREKREPVFRGC
jgi:2-(1,2-epoxy-1,2-dihydrophenyl)acetyl-CoA isomerase